MSMYICRNKCMHVGVNVCETYAYSLKLLKYSLSLSYKCLGVVGFNGRTRAGLASLCVCEYTKVYVEMVA